MMALSSWGPVLVLLPDRNSPPKKDWSGAFKPAALALKKHLGAYVRMIEVPAVNPTSLTISGAAKQKGFELAATACLDAISEVKPAHLVFLCHGWSGGVQLGFRSTKQKGRDRGNYDLLRSILMGQRSAGSLHSLCLFACSAGDEPASAKSSPGSGDNSFADGLRDFTGAPVLAHWTVGHATRNPDLIYFDASSVPLIGGTAVQRGTPLYKNARKLLHSNASPKGDVRPAWASLPLVTSFLELQALLSQAA